MEHLLETLSNCPSCDSPERSPQLKCRDYTFSMGVFTIDRCLKCGLLYTNPRPPQSEIGAYYGSPEYVSHTDTQSGLLFRLYRTVKNHTLTQKRRFLEQLSDARTVLDYGAGSGDFSAELSKNGWSVIAFEPDYSARELIKRKSNAIQLIDNLETMPEKSVSIIVLWHVLEHVHRLKEAIVQFRRILKADGKLVIAVPNHRSLDANFYRENWAAYDVPRHLYHFDHDSMTHLMHEQEFTIVSTKPMWFDSFYVSLLSEKNKRSYNSQTWLTGWPIAAVIGLLSNILALTSTKRCSSITYVLQNNY